ncbi:MAG: lysophospholipid acyltransferase family protein [Acidobacteriota bacterium]
MISEGNQDTPFIAGLRRCVLGASRLLFRIEFFGAEQVPVLGPAILVANHQSYLDPILITLPIRRPISYMAWDGLFRFAPLGWLARQFGAFPLRQEAVDKNAVRQSLRALQNGNLLMIFPEGQRSLAGKLMPFKPGFARLALLARVPVVPVTIVGADRVWPPGRFLPLPGKIQITYHPPLHAHEWEIGEKSQRAERLKEEVLKSISKGFK